MRMAVSYVQTSHPVLADLVQVFADLMFGDAEQAVCMQSCFSLHDTDVRGLQLTVELRGFHA
jgi:hypothetical protein